MPLAYYAGLVLILRLAGKRLAGQTTTLRPRRPHPARGRAADHGPRPGHGERHGVPGHRARRCTSRWPVARAPSRRLRQLLRGEPRRLVTAGHGASTTRWPQEGISRAELEAGLRKLGFDSPEEVELAVLEETGHISAVARKG